MISCSICRTSLYKERKRGEVVRSDTLLLDEPEESVECFYGDGNDDGYCSWCLKSGTETVVLTNVERMLLLCDHRIYCSRNATRCKSWCVDIPLQRFNEQTYLTSNQMFLLINDLIDEVNRVKVMSLLIENDPMIIEDDY